jgi:hypothetical protein
MNLFNNVFPFFALFVDFKGKQCFSFTVFALFGDFKGKRGRSISKPQYLQHTKKLEIHKKTLCCIT